MTNEDTTHNDKYQLSLKLIPELIGKTLEEVRIAVKESGLESRIVQQDGINYIITCDFHPWRLNLTVVNDVVTEIHGG